MLKIKVIWILCRKAEPEEGNKEKSVHWRERERKSVQRAVSWLLLHYTFLVLCHFLIANLTLQPPCRVPSSIPGWVCCLMRGLDSDPLLLHCPLSFPSFLLLPSFYFTVQSGLKSKALNIGVTLFSEVPRHYKVYEHCWVFIAWRKRGLSFMSLRPHSHKTGWNEVTMFQDYS